MNLSRLDTDRLLIRTFTMDDLAAVHQLLDVELADADLGATGTQALATRQRWLQWTVLGYEQYAALHQPPYGERAIFLKATGQLIGACGFVPCLDQFGRLPSWRVPDGAAASNLTETALGLYWAVSPRHQRQGYATEAAQALIAYAFGELRLRRIIATTSHDNVASIRVMEKVGMRLDRNPTNEPPWLQVVGLITNPESQL